MRYLWLMLLLSSVSASAVNLSTLKSEDVCVEPEIGVYDASEASPIANAISSSYVSTKAITQFSKLGFSFGKDPQCKYQLQGLVTYNFVFQNNPLVENQIYLFPTVPFSKDGLPIVTNAYTSGIGFTYTNRLAADMKVASFVDALYDAFLDDWIEAHP